MLHTLNCFYFPLVQGHISNQCPQRQGGGGGGGGGFNRGGNKGGFNKGGFNKGGGGFNKGGGGFNKSGGGFNKFNKDTTSPAPKVTKFDEQIVVQMIVLYAKLQFIYLSLSTFYEVLSKHVFFFEMYQNTFYNEL